MKEHQIQAKKYFYPALHRQKVYEELGMGYRGKLPVTEKAALSGLALPMFSHMKEDFIPEICNYIKEILK